MAELVPYPFDALVRRTFRELERHDSIFDLPRRRFFTGADDLDLSVGFHDRRASSPLGPAAGPQTQMAQNIVLSWLGGGRIHELKTIQINDRLEIPRPCIDMRTVGFNAEWSQELRLEESLDEYVKGAMLVEMLAAEEVAPGAGFGDTIYDMSVGYDLAGVRSERVRAFLDGMLDAGPTVDRLRREIPPEHRALADLDYPRRLSDTVTLSTFHGCPPEEIERIIVFLLREIGVHSIVKFNPMLLGPETARRLLHDELGYDDLSIPDSAFERDTRWEQAVEMVERLAAVAEETGLGLGVKFSNTLIVENSTGFLPESEREVYLSGPPLHVLAIHLVRRFRRAFGDRFPISFSAGIDRRNFPDAVALGLVPITVCSDLLKKGGYARMAPYHLELAKRMREVGARSVDEFVLTAYGEAAAALDRCGLEPGDPVRERATRALFDGTDLAAAAGELFDRWVSEAKLLNTERYVERLAGDERYRRAANDTPPPKIGSHLELFDCITCDICVPVCPNDANFTLGDDQPRAIEIARLVRAGDGWRWRRDGTLELAQRHQIANFADFCNDCGNCDVFCPEDGGPYIVKPRFFGQRASWREAPHLDGFYVERRGGRDLVCGRFEGREYRLESEGDRLLYAGQGFEVAYDRRDPEGTVTGEGGDEVDMTYCNIMEYLRRGLLETDRVNYVNSRLAASDRR